MAAILGTSSSAAPPTPLLKAALTSSSSTPLSSLSSPVSSTTASEPAAPPPPPSGDLEIDVDEDYDAWLNHELNAVDIGRGHWEGGTSDHGNWRSVNMDKLPILFHLGGVFIRISSYTCTCHVQYPQHVLYVCIVVSGFTITNGDNWTTFHHRTP